MQDLIQHYVGDAAQAPRGALSQERLFYLLLLTLERKPHTVIPIA